MAKENQETDMSSLEDTQTKKETVYDKYKKKINPFLSDNAEDWLEGYTPDGHAIERGSCK